MKTPKAHFYACAEPRKFEGPVVALCETEIRRPLVKTVFEDELPTGQRFDPERLPKAMCAKCRKVTEIKERYLYLLCEFQEGMTSDGAEQE